MLITHDTTRSVQVTHRTCPHHRSNPHDTSFAGCTCSSSYVSGPSDSTWRPKFPCMDRMHNPPSHMVYGPGLHRHVCPSCGDISEFWGRTVWC